MVGIVKKHNELVVLLSICSGKKNSTLLLHHPDYVVEGDGSTHQVVIVDTGRSSGIFVLKGGAFAKKHHIFNPFATFIMFQVGADNIDIIAIGPNEGEEMTVE